MIYLDNAATTKIHPDVLAAMMPYLTEEYGNPGGLYPFGRSAEKAVEKARRQVADFLNCDPEQVIFTSGGSEGNNLVIRSAMNHLRKHGSFYVFTSAMEHDSIMNLLNSDGLLDDEYYCGAYFILPENGVVNPETFRRYLSSPSNGGRSGIASVMYVNNETGAINDVKKLAEICHKTGVLFHTDCVQAAGNIPVDVSEIGCDFATVSSHKIHGPKGVGAVYVKDRSTIHPIISGGSAQEFGLRGGTENVAGIVGFGKACEIAGRELNANMASNKILCDVFTYFLSRHLDSLGMKMTDNLAYLGKDRRSPKICSLRIDGVDTQSLILMLGNEVCISAGSACSSHETTPSHVLKSLGLSDEECLSSFRVSFSQTNTLSDAINAARIIAEKSNMIQLLNK